LETGPDVLFGDFTACDQFDVMDQLEKIGAPTLVIVGSDDQLTPVKYAHFLAEHIAIASQLTVEGAGHMVMLERPSEVAKATQEFLKKNL